MDAAVHIPAAAAEQGACVARTVPGERWDQSVQVCKCVTGNWLWPGSPNSRPSPLPTAGCLHLESMDVLAPLPDDTGVHEQVDGYQSGERRGGPEERERGGVREGGGRGECKVKQVHAHRPGEHERRRPQGDDRERKTGWEGRSGGKRKHPPFICRGNIIFFCAEPPHVYFRPSATVAGPKPVC